MLPYPAVFVLVLFGALIADKKVLAQVDYSLLATFSRIFYFHRKSRQNSRLCLLAFCSASSGREILISVLASQVIGRNVPAALLLSGFSNNVPALIVGTNFQAGARNPDRIDGKPDFLSVDRPEASRTERAVLSSVHPCKYWFSGNSACFCDSCPSIIDTHCF